MSAAINMKLFTDKFITVLSRNLNNPWKLYSSTHSNVPVNARLAHFIMGNSVSVHSLPNARCFLLEKKSVSVCMKRLSSSKSPGSQGIYSSQSTPKFSSSDIKRLLALAKPEKWKLCGAICLLLVSSTVTMAVPFSLGKVIDIIYTSDSEKMKDNLNFVCAILIGVFVLGATCNFGRVYLMNMTGNRITTRIRKNVFKSILSQETAFFDKHRTGELINRLSADTSLVGQSVTMNISDGLRSGIMVVSGVSMMFYMSPSLALVSLTVVPPIVGVAIIYGRFVRKITKAVQDSLADATQVAEERISNIRTVKTFSQEEKEMSYYNSKMATVLELAEKESVAKGVFYGMTGLGGNAIIISVLYYGGGLVADNSITVGGLSAFLLYAAYIGVSMGGLTSFYSELNRGLGASARLWELTDRKPAIPISGGLVPAVAPHGDIIFKNVTFAYPSRENSFICKNLSLHVPSSSITAIVGSSGSGKSTLAYLLLRLYDPLEGQILLDGTEVKLYDPCYLRSIIGTVSQEPVLFSGTVRENILYGANKPESVSEEQLIQATKEANAYNFIMNDLPENFETRVGERGIMLSGGQKQRIAIARALIKNPRIIVLDEATSALDAESEYLVQEALEKITLNRTVMTIAHRLSTIKHADQIAVLDQGQIVEVGNYDELISKKDGTFYNLIKHQAFSS
ncbi:unnamed protein product [Bemisia tabaci]|uniref:ATP-binding cassette sub-family B member 10, mitochondrial n=1 Tax=Bemisia tabaci TaxID=7038 RepID=A0A9P0F8X6_BEMTA|nr:PREDICTED: ATP-binding cassette sub-family B member 10, mitochondrial-like [Bemisia tabaci]CAH0392928.1 unnamed protein product [Bemisia tabaci]